MKKLVRTRKRSNPLRRQAEQLIRARHSADPVTLDKKARNQIYELQVHQIELELQNEELRRAQVELADSRDRYSDLYEFAPVGYVTINEKGRILEANLGAITLLGVNRVDLVGAAIHNFVVNESRGDCYHHFRAAFDSPTRQICELNMRKKNGTPMVVCLHSLPQISPSTETPYCRTALIDVTEARVAQWNRDAGASPRQKPSPFAAACCRRTPPSLPDRRPMRRFPPRENQV
jgi:PAS domain S-box-containing protein